MNSQTANAGRLSTLDLVFSVMDSQRSPLDFTVIFHLKGTLGIEALRTGARSARNLYPQTGSYVDKQRWARFDEVRDGVVVHSSSNSLASTEAIEEFVGKPVDLHKQLPVQQLVIINGPEAPVQLVTRFHHAVADGLSAGMWLGHQLRVTYGLECPVARASSFQNLSLRRLPPAAKKFAQDGPSEPLWTSRSQQAGARRWITIDVPAQDLRQRCRRKSGFTYNDLLITCALETFTRWNRTHGLDRGRKIGLWLPVNIRQQSLEGFGNGTSRIRLHASYAETASLVDKCREVRRQISRAAQNGEWVVPEVNPFVSFPSWVVTPLLRCYLNRPSVDMATGVFSHAERWTVGNEEVFRNVGKVECIGLLPQRQGVAIYGATHLGKTWLTFTYDRGLFFSDDIQQMAAMYREQIAMAQRELI
ncbi:MAG: hypothetical protein ACREBG_07985 [Pyrinomonadaceae bacterium]